MIGGEEEVEIPLLDFVKALEEWDRDENDNGFLAVANFDLKKGLACAFLPFAHA